jgi:signal transduction histidine kinase
VAERTASLQEVVGELEHFSYTITHDMRAPLRAMQGFAGLAEDALLQGQPQQAEEFLRRIKVSSHRMDSLIKDALNYSKAVRNKIPVVPVDVSKLFRGMLETYPNLQSSIPMVMGNEAGLTQCFSNLLGNALKFVKPGSAPDIRITAEERNGWVRICIEDKGIGIPKNMLPRVFDMFMRGPGPHAGTGIGLALVRKVVDRMGGPIDMIIVEDDPVEVIVGLGPRVARNASFGPYRRSCSALTVAACTTGKLSERVRPVRYALPA